MSNSTILPDFSRFWLRLTFSAETQHRIIEQGTRSSRVFRTTSSSALISFSLTPCSGGLGPFAYFKMGILWTMSKHVVASFRVETDDAPLSWDLVTKVSPTASVATEEDFASFACVSTLGDFASTSGPSEDGFSNTNVVSPLAFSSGSRLLPAGQLTLDGKMCCLITATTKTKFSMPQTMTLCSLGQCGSAS